MPKIIERECLECKATIVTASKSTLCIKCAAKNKSLLAQQQEISMLTKNYGYTIIGQPTKNSFGKRVYELQRSCCNKSFHSTYGNIITGIKKNHKSGHGKLPCGACGPKHRMQTALKAYEDKYGIDYDSLQFKQYKRKVYGLSDEVYTQNMDKLNPSNHVRALAGKIGGYHLDHITPIIECFKMGWTPEQAASLSNLQLLPWKDNLSKGSRIVA